jgi:hypothetical protein
MGGEQPTSSRILTIACTIRVRTAFKGFVMRRVGMDDWFQGVRLGIMTVTVWVNFGAPGMCISPISG